MSHTRMSHVTHMNESWHIHERVMPRETLSHITYTNESCNTHQGVMSRETMSCPYCRQDWNQVTHVNESYHTYESVMSRTGVPYISRMKTSCHMYVESCHTYA